MVPHPPRCLHWIKVPRFSPNIQSHIWHWGYNHLSTSFQQKTFIWLELGTVSSPRFLNDMIHQILCHVYNTSHLGDFFLTLCWTAYVFHRKAMLLPVSIERRSFNGEFILWKICPQVTYSYWPSGPLAVDDNYRIHKLIFQNKTVLEKNARQLQEIKCLVQRNSLQRVSGCPHSFIHLQCSLDEPHIWPR